MAEDLDIIKSTMICIHIIIGSTQNKEPIFESADNLLKSISKSLDNNGRLERGGFYGDEILSSFSKSIMWMEARGIITFVENNYQSDPQIKIDKNKLVETIVNMS